MFFNGKTEPLDYKLVGRNMLPWKVLHNLFVVYNDNNNKISLHSKIKVTNMDQPI